MTSDKRRRAEDFYIRCTQHIANRNLHEAAIDAMLAYAAEAEAAAIARCAECVPTSWLDPMLTGKNKVISDKASCLDIEAVLREVKSRISKLKDAP